MKTRSEIIKGLKEITAELAKRYNCPNMQCGEDRQKGIWGTGFTEMLEKEFGECTQNIVFTSDDTVEIEQYKSGLVQKPARKIEFRFRFQNPCVSIMRYEGKKQIFAEMELSNRDENTGKYLDEAWKISQYTIWQDEGMALAQELKSEWELLLNENSRTKWILGIGGSEIDDVIFTEFIGSTEEAKQHLLAEVYYDRSNDIDSWDYGTTHLSEIQKKETAYYAYGSYSDYHIDYSIMPIDKIPNSDQKISIKALWNSFGDTPINPETECLEEAWMEFSEGTPRNEVWEWFEKELGISIAELMEQ